MDKQDKINDLFRIAREQEPITSFDETRERFLNSLGNKSLNETTKKVHFFNLKKWILMLTSIITIASLLFIFSSTENIEKKASNKFNSNSCSVTFSKSTNKNNLYTVSKTEKEELKLEKDQLQFVEQNMLNSSNLLNEISSISRLKSGPYYFPHVLVFRNIGDDSLSIPELTVQEIKCNNKQKKEMLKSFVKLNKYKFSYIPSGSFKNKNLSVQGFYMQNTEVTNLEYRTFLKDLLIQRRTAEYIKARPNEKMWTVVCGEDNKPMENLYFSHIAYNQYPVCNISREAAEMYCVWLTQELIKSNYLNKNTHLNSVRIPSRTEWIYAASNLGESFFYPWGTDSVKNLSGKYLANFKPLSNNYDLDGGFHTVKTISYNPNKIGMYCMSGNVAEMVYNSNNSKTDTGTAGGGWMDDSESIKINGIDKYEGVITAHPNIGFRIVMTYTVK